MWCACTIPCTLLLVSLHGVRGSEDEHEHGHETIWDLGDEIDNNPKALTVLLIFIVVVSLLVGALLKWIDVKLEKGKHFYKFVHHVYQEIMILGLLSLLLFMAEQSRSEEWLTIGRTSFNPALYEFMHMAIFFQAIFYMITVLVLLATVRFTWKRWARIDALEPDQLGSQFALLKEGKKRRFWWMSPVFLYRFNKKRHEYRYHKIKRRFLRTNCLPPDFDYVRYLRKCVRQTVLHLVEIDYRVWGLVLALSCINLIRLQSGGNVQTASRGVMPYFIAGVIITLIFFLVFVDLLRKANRYHESLKHLGDEVLDSHFSSAEAGDGYIEPGALMNLQESLVCPTGDAEIVPPVSELELEDSGASNSSPQARSSPVSSTHYLPLSIFARNYVESIDMRQYFWFRRTGFHLTIIQCLLLFQSFYLALYVLVFAQRIFVVYDCIAARLWMTVGILLCSIIILLILLPLILPIYTVMGNIESLSNVEIIRYMDIRKTEGRRSTVCAAYDIS